MGPPAGEQDRTHRNQPCPATPPRPLSPPEVSHLGLVPCSSFPPRLRYVADGEPHPVVRVLHVDTSAGLISHISIAHTQINSPIPFY